MATAKLRLEGIKIVRREQAGHVQLLNAVEELRRQALHHSVVDEKP